MQTCSGTFLTHFCSTIVQVVHRHALLHRAGTMRQTVYGTFLTHSSCTVRQTVYGTFLTQVSWTMRWWCMHVLVVADLGTFLEAVERRGRFAAWPARRLQST